MGFSKNCCLSGRLIAVASCCALTPCSVRGQLPHPRLDWVFPPGARIGGEAVVEIGGADLDDAETLRFSHSGIAAEPLREAPSEFYPDGRLQPNRFVVRVAADVPPGAYEVCSVGAFGVSTPRVFHVGEHEEVAEENIHDRSAAQPVALGTAVNGRADSDAVDYYRVAMEAGQFLRADVWGRRLDSRIDARIEATDPAGIPLAATRHTLGGDPVIAFVAPTDGDYSLAVFDSVYRGGGDRAYRLLVDDEPLIAAVFPPAIVLGGQVRGELRGFGVVGDLGAGERQVFRAIFAGEPAASPFAPPRPIWRSPAAIDSPSLAVRALGYGGAIPVAAQAAAPIGLGKRA